MPAVVRKRKYLLKAGALVVLLLAMLPNALYVGHLPLPVVGSLEDIGGPLSSEQHASHCHGGQPGCSSEASAGQSIPILDSTAFSLPELDGLLHVGAEFHFPALSTFGSRIEKPPRVV